MGPSIRIATATAGFALLHSLLASRQAKEAAARLVGERARDAWYRPVFIGQSIVATAWWARAVLREPDREVWRAPPSLAGVMAAGQIASAAAMWRAARAVGIDRLVGLPGVRAWMRGGAVPAPQEAQGPRPSAEGMRIAGPFRRSRHPLNAAPIALLWLQPRMTRNRLLVAILATAYFIIGSRHEESRMRRAYGDRYQRYRQGPARFLV
jgi:hypothetical protein